MTTSGILTLTALREAFGSGEIVVAVCRSCGAQQAIPSATCFSCGSAGLGLQRHSGSGRVFSWVVCHYAFADELRAAVPYVVVLVALDGGGRLYGRLEPLAEAAIVADMALELDPAATRSRLYPIYRPAAAPRGGTST
jgi:uncharacterized OB-fold protein